MLFLEEKNSSKKRKSSSRDVEKCISKKDKSSSKEEEKRRRETFGCYKGLYCAKWSRGSKIVMNGFENKQLIIDQTNISCEKRRMANEQTITYNSYYYGIAGDAYRGGLRQQQ